MRRIPTFLMKSLVKSLTKDGIFISILARLLVIMIELSSKGAFTY